MVRLFRGPAMPIRGRGAIRPHFMNQRQMGPLRFDPRYVNPVNGGRIIRGHHPVGLSSGPSRPPLQLPSRGTRLLRPPPMGSPRLLPPRGAPRLLPPRTPLPHPPFYPTDIRPPMHIAGRPRLPPLRHLSPRHMLPVPPSGPPIVEHHMFPPVGLLRGRGGRGRVLNRGIGLKRLGSRPTANGHVNRKKTQKHKERTEGEFFCESCDRGWKTQEKLDEHLAEHVVCGRDGCTFVGHPKIVQKHVQAQHDTGLYHKIVFTENPEDVAKWIAERKRRFPTRENVEKKKAQEKEMFERGERIANQGKPFQNKDNHSSQNVQNKRSFNGSGNNQRPLRKRPLREKKIKFTSGENKWRDPESWRGDLPRFPGTAAFPKEDEKLSNVKAETYFSDEEDSLVETKPLEQIKEKPLISSVLASLVTSYGSEFSDEEAAEDAVVETAGAASSCDKRKSSGVTETLVTTLSPKVENDSLVSDKHLDSDSGPEECAILKEDNTVVPTLPSDKEDKNCPSESKSNETNSPELKKASKTRQSVSTRYQVMKKRQPSLLEKLLQNEIRHERNLILQCVRYVVKNNFFNCGSAVANDTKPDNQN